MDLHRRRSVLVRMTGDGRKLETERITNSPADPGRGAPESCAGGDVRVVLGGGHAGGGGRGGSPGAPAGREGVPLPAGQERRPRRGGPGGSAADGPPAPGGGGPARGGRERKSGGGGK